MKKQSLTKTLMASVITLTLASVSANAKAADKLLEHYYTPEASGIVWVSVTPSFIDSGQYEAGVTIKCNGKTKKLLYKKTGDGPVTIGIPHFENSFETVSVYATKWYFSTNGTAIYNIRQGSKPTYSSQSSIHLTDFSC